MNFQKSIFISVILLIALFFLFSCATTQQAQQVSEGQIIDMGSYKVAMPLGKDWEVKTEKEKGSIQFQKLKKRLFSGVTGVTIINIFQDMPAPKAWDKSEEEIANDVRDFEEKDMIERGVKTGQAILEDVNKYIDVIDGKKLYTMSYTMKHHEKPVDTKAVLYLYFPPDFTERHILYRFLITEMYERSSSAKPDLTIIHPVIDSLKITTPALAYQKNINALLIKAAATGDIQTVRDLIYKGADVDAKEENGFTALMLASWHGHSDIVQCLIGKRADVNIKTNAGLTALLSALEQSRYDIVKILVASGADVNAKGMDDRTPLMGEAYRGNYFIVKLLLDAGADVKAKDKYGNTALIWAEKGDHKIIIQLLKEAGAKE